MEIILVETSAWRIIAHVPESTSPRLLLPMRDCCRSAFHDQKVDIYVDRVRRERPTRRFS
jgi:hypothetical protein